tara:strand:+ start:1579 stop:1887 length:309 start_codon:yes stop_codon:yes gene_type:complete
MENKENRGGKREGSGRKSKVDEESVNEIFIKALKSIYNKKIDEDAKIEFVKELAESQRGQIFIAEHIFGKPKEKIEQTTMSLDKEVTLEDIKRIRKEFFKKY